VIAGHNCESGMNSRHRKQLTWMLRRIGNCLSLRGPTIHAGIIPFAVSREIQGTPHGRNSGETKQGT